MLDGSITSFVRSGGMGAASDQFKPEKRRKQPFRSPPKRIRSLTGQV